jgi:hypothetical protein
MLANARRPTGLPPWRRDDLVSVGQLREDAPELSCLIGRESAVRTFSCFTTCADASAPILSIVFAADELRARELAGRELLRWPAALFVEVCEEDRLLFVEHAAD